MHVVHKTKSITHQHSPTCSVIEYPLTDQDLNGAIAHLTGRYPSIGTVTNTVCKEMAYVLSGSGKVVIEYKEIMIAQGDVVLIPPDQQYYWEGCMSLFLACTPAWYPEQHKQSD